MWGLGTNHGPLGPTGSGKLRAFDGETGQLLAEAPGKMPDLEHWISPIAVKGRIYVAGDKHAYAFDLGGPAAPPDAGAPAPGDGGTPPMVCLADVSAHQTDACAPFGLTCMGGAPYGECYEPGPDNSCAAGMACREGASCVTQSTGTQCRLPCATNADCPILWDACVPGPGGSFCGRVECPASSYYGACQMNGEGGTCLPVYGDDGSTHGACVAAGTATGADCSASRGFPLCTEGSFCFLGESESACAPLCDYTATAFGGAPAGPACGSGESCVFLVGYVPFGVCAPTCSSPSDCVAPRTCKAWNPMTSIGACLL